MTSIYNFLGFKSPEQIADGVFKLTDKTIDELSNNGHKSMQLIDAEITKGFDTVQFAEIAIFVGAIYLISKISGDTISNTVELANNVVKKIPL